MAFVAVCISFIFGNFFVENTTGRVIGHERTAPIINVQHEAELTDIHVKNTGPMPPKVKPSSSTAAQTGPETDTGARPLSEGPSVGPRMPYEDIGACPFEGCTYRCWTANKDTVIRSDRTSKSPAVFTVQKGEQVIGVTGTVVTYKAGRARFLKKMELAGVRAHAGQTIYLLTYLGEGYYKAWFGGKIIDGLDINEFKLLEKPKYTWWVLIQEKNGQSGWSSQAENFDHKDRLE